jgi:hypothetical protein
VNNDKRQDDHQQPILDAHIPEGFEPPDHDATLEWIKSNCFNRIGGIMKKSEVSYPVHGFSTSAARKIYSRPIPDNPYRIYSEIASRPPAIGDSEWPQRGRNMDFTWKLR